MHGGAVTLSDKFLEDPWKPRLIVVTDMVDVTTFLSLTREFTSNSKVLTYFHENQISYPFSSRDEDIVQKRDRHYGFINFTSALASNVVAFNSHYHKTDFVSGLRKFMKAYPDYKLQNSVDQIEEKSMILPLGFEWEFYDSVPALDRPRSTKKTILWNHRWEYDKNPEDFFSILFELAEERVPFSLILLGKQTKKGPSIFEVAKDKLKDQLIWVGYADTKEEYISIIKSADIMLTTSNQDFFGMSVVEAMYCGVIPILPDRLSYSEHFHSELSRQYLYYSKDEAKQKLLSALKGRIKYNSNIKTYLNKYDWKEIIYIYDSIFKKLIS
jgi:glycosyltransferase involved in cell wall biosynthesis